MLFYVWMYITLASSPAITSVTRNTTFPCSSSSISSFEEFRCQDGTACIRIEHMCDGIEDCADASDELSCLPLKRRSKRQESCIVPAHPTGGIYEVVNVPTAKPSQRFDSLVLTVRCRLGYGVQESSSQQVFCVNGKWFQNLPKCVRFCRLDRDPSVRFVCRGPNGFVECGQYVAPGTAVSPTCNSPIYYSTETRLDMKCVHGSWNYIARCKAECGRITPAGKVLLINGRSAKRGELPWHVGIYRKTKSPYMQICGGSLVEENVVISAAHCFWSDVKKLLPANNFAVAIGKLYREWENERDFDAQMSDINSIKIPTLFQGEQANFQLDIAVLILTSSFTYKPHIRPVCLNFDRNFNRLQLQNGIMGKVAGWGLTSAQGKPTSNLQVVEMPFINEEICINTLPASFREYITGDKFCAGFINGTALCQGDSGGGLAFAGKELGIERYYLRGIVSAAPTNDDKQCNDDTYTAFTKIIDHEDFIKQSIQDSLKQICPHYLFQCADGACVDQGADCNGIPECADGSDEAEELCTPPGNTTNVPSAAGKCILPPYPERGTYAVTNYPAAQPAETFASLQLTVRCSERYSLVNADGRIDENGVQVNCRNGNWDRTMPKCDQCGAVYERTDEVLLPWHVGIYYKDSSTYTLICGGSLVSNKLVISVTGCFTINRKSPYKYAVAAGKVFSRWGDDSFTQSQTSDVREIHVSYLVKQPRHKDNIAVVILLTPFEYTATVQPVCLNLQSEFALQYLNEDNLGKTVAWPLISRNEATDLGVLQTLDLVHLNFDSCSTTVPPEEDDNIQNKICTSFYNNDNTSKVILAGSGLVYPHRESGRYYLIGAKVNTVACGQECVNHVDKYHMFSKLYDFKDFLKQYV